MRLYISAKYLLLTVNFPNYYYFSLCDFILIFLIIINFLIMINFPIIISRHITILNALVCDYQKLASEEHVL